MANLAINSMGVFNLTNVLIKNMFLSPLARVEQDKAPLPRLETSTLGEARPPGVEPSSLVHLRMF
jgi:hypothetical protein